MTIIIGEQSPRDAIRQRVTTMVADICGDESCLIRPVLGACIDHAIDRRWPSPVMTFVPLLVFRDVQECVRQGQCPGLSETTWP